ncbi:hypothetical protein [Anabaena cylindrica]|uniref:Uncharacterized protein n=1 Tax=Anabaena cylindrica (strain ATCC 27899 / PCC 7122) TaxID=272123 RepID=K9ZF37_ANACC|nr:hypothetical protein [Anabaena cylindrica]AFZ57359.1 hypothetical protein Anacy_1870 [Anabaena cylindrica PCC 7122]
MLLNRISVMTLLMLTLGSSAVFAQPNPTPTSTPIPTVQQKSGEWKPRFSRADIRASISATAQQEERCVLTGSLIQAQQPMLLALTKNGDMVPLSVESLAE